MREIKFLHAFKLDCMKKNYNEIIYKNLFKKNCPPIGRQEYWWDGESWIT